MEESLILKPSMADTSRLQPFVDEAAAAGRGGGCGQRHQLRARHGHPEVKHYADNTEQSDDLTLLTISYKPDTGSCS